MQRTFVAMVAGALGGLLLAGVLVGLAVPNMPAAWRSPGLVWLAAAGVAAAGAALAVRVAGTRKT